MSKRLIWSILLVVLGIAIVVIERGPIGGTLGPFFIVLALVLWVIPQNTITGNSQKSAPRVHPIPLIVLGSGLGLLIAAAAAYWLPPQICSWLRILMGVALIVWLLLRRRR